ncbi:MAG: hypothetical protein CMH46_07795 [Muricauda sp.]|nr:hypothetical protein [Allomuricauda sp.]
MGVLGPFAANFRVPRLFCSQFLFVKISKTRFYGKNNASNTGLPCCPLAIPFVRGTKTTAIPRYFVRAVERKDPKILRRGSLWNYGVCSNGPVMLDFF